MITVKTENDYLNHGGAYQMDVIVSADHRTKATIHVASKNKHSAIKESVERIEQLIKELERAKQRLASE